jgi:hypothetical protein
VRCDGCPADPAHACFSLVANVLHLCRLKDQDPELRALIRGRSIPGIEPIIDPRLALVAACPDRGSVLPHTLQPACGCAELTECRRGKGMFPGRVTLRDCLECVCISEESQ